MKHCSILAYRAFGEDMISFASLSASFPTVLLCPVLIWITLVSFFLSICFAVQDGVNRLRRMHQVPCSRCVFFTGDYRLKCTVHPCRALSEEAIDCWDYEPLHTPQTARRWRRTFSFLRPPMDKILGLFKRLVSTSA
jgi:hypothetical protein